MKNNKFLFLLVISVAISACKDEELFRKRGMKAKTENGVAAEQTANNNGTSNKENELPSGNSPGKKKDKKQEALAKKYFFGFSHMPRGMFLPDENPESSDTPANPAVLEKNKITGDTMDPRLGENFLRRQEMYRLTPFSEAPLRVTFFFKTKNFRMDFIDMEEITAGIIDGKIIEYERTNHVNLKQCKPDSNGDKSCYWSAHPYKKTDAIQSLIDSISSQERCYLQNEVQINSCLEQGVFRTESGSQIKKSKQVTIESEGEVICISHLGETVSFGHGIKKSVTVTSREKGDVTTPNADEKNEALLLVYEKITSPDGSLIFARKHEVIK